MTEKTKNARSKAYNAALQSLKSAHPEDFAERYEKACVDAGIEFVVRLTAEQRAQVDADLKRAKAAAKVAQILAEYPDLAPVGRVVVNSDPGFSAAI